MPVLANTTHGQQVACWMHVAGSAHGLAPVASTTAAQEVA
jgi:hypothetical protein